MCIIIFNHCEPILNVFDDLQEQSDLMREIEDLGVQLKKSQKEVDKSREEVGFHNFPSLFM